MIRKILETKLNDKNFIKEMIKCTVKIMRYTGTSVSWIKGKLISLAAYSRK